MVQQRDEGTIDFESEHEKVYNFTIDVDKFVLDYERQKKFLKRNVRMQIFIKRLWKMQ